MLQLYPKPKVRLASLVFCLFALLTAERKAFCQDEPPPAEQTKQADQSDCLSDSKCSEMYETARRLSVVGQYEAALVSYQSAYVQKPTPWLLVNIGRMQQKAGRPQQAIRTFKRFLDDPLAHQDIESQTKAREYLQQAEEEVRVQQQSSEGTQLPEFLPSNKAKERTKIPAYKKWWFWTAVGGAAAVVAVGLAAGLTARAVPNPQAPPSVPQGVSVYDTGF